MPIAKSKADTGQSSTLTDFFTAITTLREYHGQTIPKWPTVSPHTPLCHSADPHATARKKISLYWDSKEKRAAHNAIFVVLPNGYCLTESLHQVSAYWKGWDRGFLFGKFGTEVCISQSLGHWSA